VLLLLFELFDDVIGEVDEEDEDVDEAEERGGDVVVGILVFDGDRVRAILAGGGAPMLCPNND
jgi:hypothetical protein